ncbi:hypothetical protein D3C85_1272200 [compost metagenome]
MFSSRLRTGSRPSLARFSAQSVSIRPTSGSSVWITKPLSCQKAFSSGQTCAGLLPSTLIQRWLPARSICALAFWSALTTTLAATLLLRATSAGAVLLPLLLITGSG